MFRKQEIITEIYRGCSEICLKYMNKSTQRQNQDMSLKN